MLRGGASHGLREQKSEQAGTPQQTAAADRPAANPLKNAYFGDLHLHTRNSFDAYIFNVRASPDEAYAYAKGGTIKHAAGFEMKLNSGPLDFLAVTDHSEYLGVLQAIDTEGDPYSKVSYANDLFATDPAKVTAAFRKFADTLDEGKRMSDFADLRTVKSAWGMRSKQPNAIMSRASSRRLWAMSSPPRPADATCTAT